MIWQKILCKQSIGYWVVLGLVLIASTVSIEAQLVPGPVPVPSPQHTTVFSLPQNVSNSPDASSNHQIAVDSQGNINIIWLDKSPGYQAVFFSHSTDGGRSFSAPQNLSNDPNGSFSVQMVVDPAGNIYVIWDDVNNNGFLTRSTDGGNSFSAPVNMAYGALAVDSSGNIYLASQGPSANRFPAIYVSRSSDEGATFSTPVQASDGTSLPGTPSIALDSAGNVYLVWVNCPFGGCYLWFNHSNDGGASFGSQVALSSTEDAPSFSLTVGSAGSVYIASAIRSSGVALTWSVDGGTTFNRTGVASGAQQSFGKTQVAVDAVGNVNMVWDQGNAISYSVFFGRSVNGGATFSSINIGASRWPGQPQIALGTGGEINIVWVGPSPNYDVFFERSTDGGASFSALQKLSNNTGNDSPTPLIALDSCGNPKITWIDNTAGNLDIFFSRGITAQSILSGCAVLPASNSGIPLIH